MATPTDLGSVLPRKKQRRFYTPATERTKPKTPHTKRIKTNHNEELNNINQQSFKELLLKQWYIHSLSPLFNFKHSPQMFKRYARSLDMAFTQAVSTYNVSLSNADMKSSFDVYPGLDFHPDDHGAVRIQITGKNQPDMDGSIFTPDLAPEFCYYPVIIVNGNKTRVAVLLEWLEQHFDCRTSPLSLTDTDLKWILAAGCSQTDYGKKMDVLLQYDIGKVCSGIHTMNCTFDFEFCQELWHRLNEKPPLEDTISDDEVKRFLSALVNHIEYTMHIYVSKLSLCEIGSPMAYVSTKGKFKMFSHHSVYPTLHLICDIAKERYTQFYQS